MTFSEFAKMLYPYLGDGMPKFEYVIFLTSLIIEEPQDRDRNQYNDLSKLGTSMLEKIYRGTAKIKPEYAGIILAHSDKEQFRSHLLTLSSDVVALIGKAMLQREVTIPDNDINTIATTCSDIFISILDDCATFHSKMEPFRKPANMVEEESTSRHIESSEKKYSANDELGDFFNLEPIKPPSTSGILPKGVVKLQEELLKEIKNNTRDNSNKNKY